MKLNSSLSDELNQPTKTKKNQRNPEPNTVQKPAEFGFREYLGFSEPCY